LVTEADRDRWTPEEPLWVCAKRRRGLRTVAYPVGSDWPINESAGGYVRWFRLAEEFAAPSSQVDQYRFFRRNAEEVYRLR
jgi:L-fuconolactonase